MTSPFDIVSHLNSKTELEYDIKEYNPFMINKIMSNTIDTLFFADAMNRFYHLDKDIQRDFYWYGLSKAKRFGKYNKTPVINKELELIMQHYQCNLKVAESYFKLMSDEAKYQLHESMNQGGSNGRGTK